MPTGSARASRLIVLSLALFAGVTGCSSGPSSPPELARARGNASSASQPASKQLGHASLTPAPSRTSPRCSSSQISLTYRGGGFATGNNFGVIVLSNVGVAACQVRNLRLAVSPIDTAGRVIKTARWTNVAGAVTLTLSAHGGPPRADQPAPVGDAWAAVVLGGAGRDDPKQPDGLCASSDEVTPAAWRVTGPLSATVRNVDPYLIAHPSPGLSPSVFACADPDLALLNINIAQQP